jgi:cytochrome P450
LRSKLWLKPSPPRTSFLLGNLPVAADCQEHFPPKTHPHAWCRYIQKKYNLGDFFYVDLWPFGPKWLFITDPDIASRWVTTGQSLNKSPRVVDYLSKLLGHDNMVGLDGSAWKRLRAMFNPGFASGHLMTLLPYMVDMSVIFCEKLREKAKTGEIVEMEELAARLTIDIMGKIVLQVCLLFRTHQIH